MRLEEFYSVEMTEKVIVANQGQHQYSEEFFRHQENASVVVLADSDVYLPQRYS